MFFLVLLLVVFLPLAEGALFALALRELYIRHPLPLGGIIPALKPPQPTDAAQTADDVEIQDITPESVVITEAVLNAAADGGNVQEASNVQAASPTDAPVKGVPPESPANEQGEPLHSGISVFEEAGSVPDHLPVNNLLESMTAEASVIIPSDLENRIDALALSADAIPEELHTHPDDTNPDHLQELADALTESLPQTKIDFSQELEAAPELADAFSPMAKELLGENFDFDALEQQSKQAKQSIQVPVPADNADDEHSTTDSREIALDIQEDESGTVQVSSPFVVSVAPQLADFTTPQTIVSTFSDDWIQETNSTADEMMLGDPARFCFSEESRPMFVRRSKSG